MAEKSPVGDVSSMPSSTTTESSNELSIAEPDGTSVSATEAQPRLQNGTANVHVGPEGSDGPDVVAEKSMIITAGSFVSSTQQAAHGSTSPSESEVLKREVDPEPYESVGGGGGGGQAEGNPVDSTASTSASLSESASASSGKAPKKSVDSDQENGREVEVAAAEAATTTTTATAAAAASADHHAKHKQASAKLEDVASGSSTVVAEPADAADDSNNNATKAVGTFGRGVADHHPASEHGSAVQSGSTGATGASQELTTPEKQADPTTTEKHPSAADEDEDDAMTSQAAKALAAVAAAATASNASPSAQAEAARALAPGIIPEAAISALPVKREGNRELIAVRASSVRECLRRRLESLAKSHAHDVNEVYEGLDADISTIQSIAIRLAKGENDAFLQYLLLLEYFVTETEGSMNPRSPLSPPRPTVPMSPKAQSPPAMPSTEDAAAGSPEMKDPNERDRTLAATEKARSMLAMADEAYDSITALLPPMPNRDRLDTESSDFDYYGIDAPAVVPDLLPPCTSPKGDATSQFFKACLGENRDNLALKEGFSVSHPSVASVENSEPEVEAPPPVLHDGSRATDKAETAHTANSVLSNVIASMTRGTRQTSPLAGMFRRKSRHQVSASTDKVEVSLEEEHSNDNDYAVVIDREMLGLTVENVLERTVVRTVLPGGAAKKAGAKVGSLIVKVGNVDTKNLTHFETIDELRQSQRPLKLALRPISSDALRSAREEMGRLIRGGGFGTSLPVDQDSSAEEAKNDSSVLHGRRMPSKVEAFSQVLHHRWSLAPSEKVTKKESALLLSGEKLVWILTLLVIGLEREAAKQGQMSSSLDADEPSGVHSKKNSSWNTPDDYAEAARSVSKVLYDFVNPQLNVPAVSVDVQTKIDDAGFAPHIAAARRKKAPPPPPQAKSKAMGPKSVATQILLRIGDVLHRTMSFLADPASPPAALLRGEVIAFLCDILDIDTEMELSEDEAVSSSAEGGAGPINDLGPAGSLLKLVILNCSMMRSPECATFAAEKSYNDKELVEEQRRRFGSHKKISGVDIHRLHAGNRFLAVVHRLAASRSVSARIAACSLGPVLWGHLDFPHQLQLRGVITRALHDVDVLVRKATATVLHEIAELVFDPRAVPWLVLMCERAMTDPEPQLRAAAMTLTWHLAEHLPNAFLGDASQGSRSVRRLPPRTDPTFAEVYLLQCKLLPVATRLAEDRAPPVRLAVAAQCDRLCNALGDHWYNIIIDVLQALLQDADERVRGEAILCFPRLAEILLVGPSSHDGGASTGSGVLEALLPVSIKLQKDQSVNVRVSLATAAGELLTLLVGLQSLEEITQQTSKSDLTKSLSDVGPRGNKRHVDETLIPLLQQLLHDSDPEVTSAALRAVTNASRGNVREIQGRKVSTAAEDDAVSLSSFHSHSSNIEKKDPVFIPVLSEAQVLRLLPTLSGLATSRQWRVRQGAVEIVPALLGCTKKLETRSEIAQLCFQLMSDRVDAVRRTAAECLCLGGDGLGSHEGSSGSEWMTAIVIPHVRYCSTSQSVKQRILALKMIEVITLNGVCPQKVKASVSTDGDSTRTVNPQRQLVDVALGLASDRIANVRLNVGRTFFNIMGILEDEEVAAVTKGLQQQLESEQSRDGGGDRDVLFFARRAISQSLARTGDESSGMSSSDGIQFQRSS